MQSIYWLEKVLKIISLYVNAFLCTLQHIVIHAMHLSGVNSPLVCEKAGSVFVRHSVVLCYSYSVLSYIQYIDQQMHILKYNKLQIIQQIHDKYHPHFFQHQSIIFR